MIEATITVSDGNPRSVTYKQFGNEIRVYRVRGDITSQEALAELAQELCFANNGTTKVTFNL